MLAGVPGLRDAGLEDRSTPGSGCHHLMSSRELLEDVYKHKEFYYTSVTEVPERRNKTSTSAALHGGGRVRARAQLYTQLGCHVAVTAMDMVEPDEGADGREHQGVAARRQGPHVLPHDRLRLLGTVWPGTRPAAPG